MEVLYQRCAGLDVHKDTVVACVRLARRRRDRVEVRSFKTTTRAAGVGGLACGARRARTWRWRPPGVYWKPVWHVLETASFELVLANAAHMKNVPGRKTDMNDATWIADLLAHGLIRASFVPARPIQELRDLTRTRKQLVREQHQPYAAHPEDAGGRQHQARLGDQPTCWARAAAR